MGRVDFRSERGVAFTEFALIAPVFLLLVAGVLAFGRVFFYWIQTNHIASETARWAVVDRNPYPVTLQRHAQDSATLEFSDAAVCIGFKEKTDPFTASLGDPVEVIVEKSFYFIPLVNVGEVRIRGSSEMRIERFAEGASPASYGSDDNLGTYTGPPSGETRWTCDDA